MPFLLEPHPIPAVGEFIGESDIGGMNEVEVDEVLLLVHALDCIELFLKIHELSGHTTCVS